jgi:hypothetical protein
VLYRRLRIRESPTARIFVNGGLRRLRLSLVSLLMRLLILLRLLVHWNLP